MKDLDFQVLLQHSEVFSEIFSVSTVCELFIKVNKFCISSFKYKKG